MKNTLYGIFIILLLVFASAGEGKCEDRFGYEKKDRVEEQKMFVARLKADSKKVDMAIKNTKTLIDRSRNRSYLPDIYLRLAELYIEKSRLAYFIRSNGVQGPTDSLNQLESTIFKNQAIETYQRILDAFPDFDYRSKVHFFLAHEYRELGRMDQMVEQYQTIISKYKVSVYVPEAHLLLGDYFINKLDLPAAEKNYKAVLNYPQSPAVSIARYKLAWVHINNSEFKEAIKLFEESVTSATGGDIDIDTYKRVDIKLESMIDMAYCYTEVYKESSPLEAIAYFKKYAWSRSVYTVVLEKLAYRYFIKKKWDHAAVIYRHLSELQQTADKLLEYAHNIFECVQEMGTFEKADQDVAYIVKALKRQKYSVHISRKEKENNMNDYEVYARNIVTHLHDKARKGMSEADFKRAADAYKLYLEFFGQSPAYEEMKANYAESLFSSKQYFEAGKEYEEMASRNLQKDKQKEEVLYSAATSYYNSLKQKDDLNYYQTAFARGGLKTVGRLYASHFPESGRVPDILFNVAWISYDEGKYDEAIEEFGTFIDQYPNGKAAKAAIHLTLDAFNLKEDFEGLISFGQKIIDNRSITDNKLKAEVSSIVRASESKIVSTFTVTAMDDWEKGKSSLVDFVEENKTSGMGEQVLNTLIVSSKERGDLETLFSTGGRLIAQYSGSAKIGDSLGVMIDTSLKISQFRILAGYLEEFANRFPDHNNANEFYFKAAQIRKRLGQYDLSNRNYKRALERAGKDEDRAEEIVFAVADNFKQIGKIDDAVDFLQRKRTYLGKTGKVKADALLSIAYFDKGEFADSLKYQKRALKAYRPEQGKEDDNLKSLMAQTAYRNLEKTNSTYMEIQLRGSIDNKVVAAKSKLLEKLESGYLDVSSYQSPDWALNAFYRASEINREFARFLKEAPLPELSVEEKNQYLNILNDKAGKYEEKANEYLKTFMELAHKWEIIDLQLTQHMLSPEDGREMSSFSEAGGLAKIGMDFLSDAELKNFHDLLMKNPKDIRTLLSLAKAYVDRQDYGQALLIAQKALDETDAHEDRMKAGFYNLIGVSQIYNLDDKKAKNALKKALEIDPGNFGAKLNLAGLYQYYGHTVKAKSMYESLPNLKLVEDSTGLIHPKAKELYYAYISGSKK